MILFANSGKKYPKTATQERRVWRIPVLTAMNGARVGVCVGGFQKGGRNRNLPPLAALFRYFLSLRTESIREENLPSSIALKYQRGEISKKQRRRRTCRRGSKASAQNSNYTVLVHRFPYSL